MGVKLFPCVAHTDRVREQGAEKSIGTQGEGRHRRIQKRLQLGASWAVLLTKRGSVIIHQEEIGWEHNMHEQGHLRS
jgi:hypothetical protein